MKKSTLRLLIREAIEQVFEAEIKYNVGDRVEIDSSANGGIGTVEVAAHPTYAIKFDQTGITDSHHFSDLRPFNDEEEQEKNADINTGLDENTELNTDDVVAAIQRSNMVDDAKQLIFKAYKDGKLTAKNAIKIIEKTSSKRISESSNPTDSISLDVPLFIRMLEYAREDAKTDMDLHDVTENALKLSTTGKTLTMADYNKITSKK